MRVLHALVVMQDAGVVDHGTNAKSRGGVFKAISDNRVVKALTFVRTASGWPSWLPHAWQLPLSQGGCEVPQGFPSGQVLPLALSLWFEQPLQPPALAFWYKYSVSPRSCKAGSQKCLLVGRALSAVKSVPELWLRVCKDSV